MVIFRWHFNRHQSPVCSRLIAGVLFDCAYVRPRFLASANSRLAFVERLHSVHKEAWVDAQVLIKALHFLRYALPMAPDFDLN